MELIELLNKFNIVPRNNEIYDQAFFHSSYCNEHNLKNDYERLEFLGDKVLDLVISEYLYRKKISEEGEMTKIRASYVCENALYEYALGLHFNEYIKVGKGEENNGGKYKKAILADAFESFIGAVYLDQGLNKVKEIINKVIIPVIESKKEVFFQDYKSMLQELVQTDKRSVVYEIVRQSGPAHDKLFTVVVKVDDINYGTGTARTKKEAEQEAARDALNKQAKL